MKAPFFPVPVLNMLRSNIDQEIRRSPEKSLSGRMYSSLWAKGTRIWVIPGLQ